MKFRDYITVFVGKCIFGVSKILRLGAGGTWPGEVALALDPEIFQYFASRFSKGIILVAGTNGKTTTSLMIKKVLESDNQRVVHNDSGANLLNGLVSACIKHASWNGSFKADYGVFEVDENALPEVVKFLKFIKLKVIIVLLNLFRDQLDRYGEVDVIAEKWMNSLCVLTKDNTIILNSDDPLIAHIGKKLKAKSVYFGINDPSKYLKNLEHATDSIFCLNCGARLTYDGIYFSHIGIWKCMKCGEKRPTPDLSTWKSPLPGLYNTYNTLAAVSVAKNLGYKDQAINTALSTFTPAFGRQEEFEIDGKRVKIFLSKNPAGFNESLKTVLELGATQLLFVLNDRIPDGRDVSWIWDVDFELITNETNKRIQIQRIVISGDRAYDLALRLKYTKPFHKLPKGAVSEPQTPVLVYEDLHKALDFSLISSNKDEPLYILATYSAMLEVRKILKGRKIL